jgi:hypothetical protein
VRAHSTAVTMPTSGANHTQPRPASTVAHVAPPSATASPSRWARCAQYVVQAGSNGAEMKNSSSPGLPAMTCWPRTERTDGSATSSRARHQAQLAIKGACSAV